MTALFLLASCCLLAAALIIARYVRHSRQQSVLLDLRCHQALIAHKPQLPRPYVRVWYGPPDVQTHVVAPTRQQILAVRSLNNEL